MKGTEKGCRMNERIRQVLADAALKGMSEMELFNLRGRLEAAHRMEEFRRLLPDVRVLEAADRVERVCKSQLIGSPVDAYPVSAAPPASVAPPAAPTPAPSASAPAVAAPEPVAAINSLPKAQWKVPRSNRWTKAAKDQMHAMRATYSDRQIADAFELKQARQVGKLIRSRLANRFR